MLPVIALVGHPNVGKSTLFNRLTATRDALVADQPGLTRDRQYGIGRLGDFPYLVVDTGGLVGNEKGLDQLMAGQAWAAVQEADAVVFLVDARDGLSAADHGIADRLRRLSIPVRVVANKAERLDPAMATAEFHELGLDEPLAISAAHGQGVSHLLEQLAELLPDCAEDEAEQGAAGALKVAIVGRPNAGKSTLVNQLLGEQRVLAFDEPGTTRDAIRIPFQRRGKDYTLIDTAGLRRRSKVHEIIEKFSAIKTLQAIEEANVVVLVMDAQREIGDQDLRLLGHVLDAGRGLVIAVNKWDDLSREQRDEVKRQIDRKLAFVDFAAIHYISALQGSGVNHLLKTVDQVHQSIFAEFPTPMLTRLLEQAIKTHAPPSVHGRRIKLRYAHQGGRNPPTIVIHGNQTDAMPDSYRRYLSNLFRRELGLEGTPLRIELRQSDNPFKGKRNILTHRQQKKRKRLLQHVKH
jgi:GTP-binding protein